MEEHDQSNMAVVNQLANWLAPLGFKVDIKPVAGHPGKANIIATMGEGRGGLVLSGHTDTVPFDEHLWQSNPFEIDDRDNRFFGLGICDMKSFLAMCISVASEYKDKTLSKPLTIVGTADEESSMSGARALSHQDLSFAKYALIGEPTLLRPINRHKGIMMLKLLITGSSGHSSNPELGNNALDATGPMIEAMKTFRNQMAQDHVDTRFEVAVPTLNLGCIHGGDNPNRICDHIEMAFDLRLLPGMNGPAIVESLHQHLLPIASREGLTLEMGLLHDALKPFQNNQDDLINTLADLHASSPNSVAFATEAPFLSEMGIETIVMGPGSIDQAHQPNEFLDQSQITPTLAIIRGLINHYCI